MPIKKGTKCPRCNITYYGPMCPQCIKDAEREKSRERLEPLRKAEQKKEAQEQLRLILAKLEKAILVKETETHKLFICPYCGRKSLFFYKASEKYECLNPDDSLTISIKTYTEIASRWPY